MESDTPSPNGERPRLAPTASRDTPSSVWESPPRPRGARGAPRGWSSFLSRTHGMQVNPAAPASLPGRCPAVATGPRAGLSPGVLAGLCVRWSGPVEPAVQALGMSEAGEEVRCTERPFSFPHFQLTAALLGGNPTVS